MPTPDYQTLMLPVLRLAGDGETAWLMLPSASRMNSA